LYRRRKEKNDVLSASTSHKLFNMGSEVENLRKEAIEKVLESFGSKYSLELGIDLSRGKPEEVFKWFLASILFGAPLPETIVFKAYHEFEKEGLLSAEKIVEAGWSKLVEILDRGSYVRLDFKTATKLLQVMGNLLAQYKGDLALLHEQAMDSRDLEKRLKDLGKGIGDVTVSIFLRDLRGVWIKADPKPTPFILLAARNLGIVETKDPEKALEELKKFWKENEVSGAHFVNFESALLRLGKNFCRKRRCGGCLVKDFCGIHAKTA
jgi:endonuclease III